MNLSTRTTAILTKTPLILILMSPSALAWPGCGTIFTDTYSHIPSETETLGECQTCHQDAGGGGNFNPYGDDLLANGDSKREFEVHLLDPTRDGIEQISDILAGYDDVDAVHLISHATEGQVKLGNTWLSMDSLAGYAGEVASWNTAFRDGGDLLIYGCDLAANEDGEALTEAILRLIDSEELRSGLGASAVETIRERADHQTHMARMEQLSLELVENWKRR